MDANQDIVLSLLETPFTQRTENDIYLILKQGRPTPHLESVTEDSSGDKRFSRYFKFFWYQHHKWLCGSSYRQRLFCWPCLIVGKTKSVWTTEGYYDLKNISRSIKLHESSKDHILNHLNLVRFEKSTRKITKPFEEQREMNKVVYNENVRKNRLIVTRLIEVALLLGQQDLAFDGNFERIFNLLIKHNSELVVHWEQSGSIFNGQMKTIQKELLGCIREYVLEKIKTEISECTFFCLKVDDTTDIVEKSQCAISLRYVNKSGNLRERFIGLYDVSKNRTADEMFALLTSVLKPYDFKKKLIAQCYDGASVMLDQINILQEKVRTMSANALFTHCYAHRLDLLLQQGSNYIPQSRNYFATLTAIADYFRKSPKRTSVLGEIVRKPIAPILASNEISKIVNLMVSEWGKFTYVFQCIIEDCETGIESVHAAESFVKKFRDFEFAFMNLVYKAIFEITDHLYQVLRSKCLDVQLCITHIDIAYDQIQALRTKDNLLEFFDAAKQLGGNPIDGKLSYESILRKFELLYHELIDNTILQLSVRFEDFKKLKFFSLADSTKYKSFKEFPCEDFECLMKSYSDLFDSTRLKNELLIIYRDENFFNKSVQETLKNFNEEYGEIFFDVYNLFSFILTVPSTVLPIERNFLCLKQLNIDLRSTSQEELSALATLSIEKEYLAELSNMDGNFYDNIINKFAILRERGINLIHEK